tara:strand:- start:358 stop:507 length:150 start_codon:yes stop_codon:yes gene_type:complete
VITTFVKKSDFSFLGPKWPKMDEERTKMGKNGISSNIVVSYIVGLLMVR